MEKFKLTDLEWQVMSAIWEINKPVTVREVLSNKYPNNEKAYTTVQTVMNKLKEKKFLTSEKIGLVNFYKPTGKKQTVLKKEVQGFMNKAFSGSFNSMISFLINSNEIDDNELKELKKLILEKERSKND